MKSKMFLILCFIFPSVSSALSTKAFKTKDSVEIVVTNESSTKSSLLLPAYLNATSEVLEDGCGYKKLEPQESCRILLGSDSFIQLYTYEGQRNQQSFFTLGEKAVFTPTVETQKIFERRDTVAVGSPFSWSIELEEKNCLSQELLYNNSDVKIKILEKKDCLLKLEVTPSEERAYDVGVVFDGNKPFRLKFSAELRSLRSLSVDSLYRVVEGIPFDIDVFVDNLGSEPVILHPSLVFLDGGKKVGSSWLLRGNRTALQVGSLEKELTVEKTSGAWIYEDYLKVSQGEIKILRNSSKRIFGFDTIDIEPDGILVLENDADPLFYLIARDWKNQGTVIFKNHFQEESALKLLDYHGVRSFDIKSSGALNLLVYNPTILGKVDGGPIWTLPRTIGGKEYEPRRTIKSPLTLKLASKEETSSLGGYLGLGVLFLVIWSFILYRMLVWWHLFKKNGD